MCREFQLACLGCVWLMLGLLNQLMCLNIIPKVNKGLFGMLDTDYKFQLEVCNRTFNQLMCLNYYP